MSIFIKNNIILLVLLLFGSTAVYQNTGNSKAEIPICENKECFAIKFKTCDPASYTIVTSMGTAKYEILGEEKEGCKVKLIYLDNPNPEWENKPLICIYDNSKEFQAAAKEALISAMMETGEAGCEGPLLEFF